MISVKKGIHIPILLAVFAIMAAMTAAGCLQQDAGGEKDEHGCFVDAGERWCPAEQRCIGSTERCRGDETIASFEACVAAGYPVMESQPRRCRVPDGRTFTEGIGPEMCRAGGGHWNECSNRCMLDNAGKPGTVCTAVCEPLCECAGFAGFGCPEGYACRAPEGIPDALGYCVPIETRLSQGEAYRVANASNCSSAGRLNGTPSYNQFTGTWWIDLDPIEPNPLCHPACVVNDTTGEAEVNWRCTGLVPPLHEEEYLNLTCRSPSGAAMTLGEALRFASTGPCAGNGTMTERHMCNAGTGTWWIDLEPKEPAPGCSPACVVHLEDGMSEVNWRCTGLATQTPPGSGAK